MVYQFHLIYYLQYLKAEPTIENGCRGDITEDNNKCLRVVNDRQRHQIDSLNYELKLLQQKFHYECTDRKSSL